MIAEALRGFGKQVADQGATRNSLVVHTTPKGASVGHQDVFYGRDADRPAPARCDCGPVRSYKAPD